MQHLFEYENFGLEDLLNDLTDLGIEPDVAIRVDVSLYYQDGSNGTIKFGGIGKHVNDIVAKLLKLIVTELGFGDWEDWLQPELIKRIKEAKRTKANYLEVFEEVISFLVEGSGTAELNHVEATEENIKDPFFGYLDPEISLKNPGVGSNFLDFTEA